MSIIIRKPNEVNTKTSENYSDTLKKMKKSLCNDEDLLVTQWNINEISFRCVAGKYTKKYNAERNELISDAELEESAEYDSDQS